jgi:hypothetical protein
MPSARSSPLLTLSRRCRTLADVRKLAKDAPKAFAGSEQFKKDMEALTAGVLEKHDAIALKFKALTDGALNAAIERTTSRRISTVAGSVGVGPKATTVTRPRTLRARCQHA